MTIRSHHILPKQTICFAQRRKACRVLLLHREVLMPREGRKPVAATPLTYIPVGEDAKKTGAGFILSAFVRDDFEQRVIVCLI